MNKLNIESSTVHGMTTSTLGAGLALGMTKFGASRRKMVHIARTAVLRSEMGQGTLTGLAQRKSTVTGTKLLAPENTGVWGDFSTGGSLQDKIMFLRRIGGGGLPAQPSQCHNSWAIRTTGCASGRQDGAMAFPYTEPI